MAERFVYSIEVSAASIDGNGHVNNVEFVRWMQEAAVAHADAVGCTAATRAAGATWLARSHHIEYLRPAFVNQRIDIQTWVHDWRRAFSKRKYEFIRDGQKLAEGETEWVFVDTTTGKPKSVPAEIAGMFEIGEQK